MTQTQSHDANENPLRAIKGHYRTSKHNLARDFFEPCLASFQTYRRAAGFFSSSALRTWAVCLPRLAADGAARIRLLISPELSHGDAQALSQTIDDDQRERLLNSSADQFIREVFEFQDGRNNSQIDNLSGKLLAWLIVHGRVELRLAINLFKGVEFGIFHKKIGILDYPAGEQIAFTGSANESKSAHEVNDESVEVYRSWIESERERIQTKIEEFEEAWNSQVPNLKVLQLSENALSYIRTVSPELAPEMNPDTLVKPDPLSGLWEHQKIAAEEFLKAGNGILEMATGSGKTRTALAIASVLRARGDIDSMIVTMKGTDLLAQWFTDLCPWASANIFKRVHRHFDVFHEREDYLLCPEDSVLLASRSALGAVFKQLRKLNHASRTLIIHDEVHDLGSPGGRDHLGGQADIFPFRLGLSATPERTYDADGTAFIEREIGQVVFRFGIEDAIRARILCPFRYIALPYQLTEEDRQDLKRVYTKQKAAESSGQPWSEEMLWIELSRVYKKAREKLPVFARFLKTQEPSFLKWAILFVEDRKYADDLYEIVHQETNRFSCYYENDSPEVLHRFVEGDLDCLITCHKISQGIDIRSLEKVILFASASARLETIQRLGRCLRTTSNNPAKVATVVDFVLADSLGVPDPEGVDYERFVWFTELSKIKPDLK